MLRKKNKCAMRMCNMRTNLVWGSGKASWRRWYFSSILPHPLYLQLKSCFLHLASTLTTSPFFPGVALTRTMCQPLGGRRDTVMRKIIPAFRELVF